MQTLFIQSLGLSQNALTRDINVPPRRINEIVNRKRRITADTAMRLSRYFDMTPRYWMGRQSDYDLDTARDELEEKIRNEVTPRKGCTA